MRIGIDGRPLQDSPWSGVGQYTYGLLRALFELDRENVYVVWYNAFDIRRQGLRRARGLASPYPTFSEYPNVHVQRTKWPNKVLNAGMKMLGRPQINRMCHREESRRFGRGDVAISAPLHEIASATPRNDKGGAINLFFMPNLNFIALPADTRLILTVHDLSFEHFPEHFSWKSRIWHRAVGPRALLKRANQVIAMSDHTREDLVETYGIPREKISVIYPGVHSRHPEAAAEEPALSLPKGSRTVSDGIPRGVYPSRSGGARNDDWGEYVLYFGALEPRKNIEGLIAAFEALTLPSPKGSRCAFNSPLSAGEERDGGWGLVIAGLSTPYVTRLKKRITRSPVRERIILKENPTEQEKWALYSGARLFVYPSFYEGFGFPPLEAMSVGVPVVASSASSVPEVCGDAAVLVSPWKIDEITDGMRVLLEDEEVRRRYVEAGHKRVQDFSWERCAKRILEAFREGQT